MKCGISISTCFLVVAFCLADMNNKVSSFQMVTVTQSTSQTRARARTRTKTKTPPLHLLQMQSNNDEEKNVESVDEDNNKGRFILPSLNQVLLGFLFFSSASRLSEAFLSIGTDQIETKVLGIVLNGALNLVALVLFFNSVQDIPYDNLEGFELKSLAKQAGLWARSGQVPTTFQFDHDGNNNNNDDDDDDQLYEVATFAGGCFWGTELHFQRIPGVVATCVGYTQGDIPKPNYEQVCTGQTGHTEGIQLLFQPQQCTYQSLVRKLMSTIPDPTLLNQVGNDRGTQYRHGIYFHSEEQKEAAKQILGEYEGRVDGSIATELLPAKVFWPAENYHQRYLEKGGQSAEKDASEKVRCYG
eukprot:CAMPEP_0202453002 /NCGR_PEP_ID=MMETSP1360-20130828/11088_1 /ASSEMBLY_ACC=CAM_ASM_000848 /TAXON_ID=515479 /ORGANISM="Licmophora paradoxa, Strain CCMP2313" /LENGTH=356 /DNA_ID=CAMNT_0049071989 /DNA_START=846 /DNA_END=1916 /DNA_ORIENTATION=-